MPYCCRDDVVLLQHCLKYCASDAPILLCIWFNNQSMAGVSLAPLLRYLAGGYTCELNINYLGACVAKRNCPATGLNLNACQNLCDATSGCRAAVHNKLLGGSCYLKKEKGKTKPDDPKYETRGCAPPYTCELNVNYLGACVAKKNCPATGLTLNACLTLCHATSGCKAVVHNKRSGGSPSIFHYYLLEVLHLIEVLHLDCTNPTVQHSAHIFNGRGIGRFVVVWLRVVVFSQGIKVWLQAALFFWGIKARL